MSECVKVLYFTFNPAKRLGFDAPDSELRVPVWDNGDIILEFGGFGCRFTANMTKAEIKDVVMGIAPYIGLSVVDADEVWEQEHNG